MRSYYSEIIKNFVGLPSGYGNAGDSFFKAFAIVGMPPPMEDEDYIVKEEEYEINGIKTTIKTYFTPEGYPVKNSMNTISMKSGIEGQREELQNKLQQAIEAEDFLKAAEIQKQIKGLPPPEQK